MSTGSRTRRLPSKPPGCPSRDSCFGRKAALCMECSGLGTALLSLDTRPGDLRGSLHWQPDCLPSVFCSGIRR